MSGRFPALVALALLGALGSRRACPAAGRDGAVPPVRIASRMRRADKPATPVELDVEANLDFDRLILAGPGDGSAELGPDGVRTVTGSVTAISARAMVGEVVIRGEPGRVVRIELPRQYRTLWAVRAASIRLESIRSDLPPDAAPRRQRPAPLPIRRGGAPDRAMPTANSAATCRSTSTISELGRASLRIGAMLNGAGNHIAEQSRKPVRLMRAPTDWTA